MKKNIFKVSLGVVILEILLKLFGFVKQSVIANYYGATGVTDVYFMAEGFVSSISGIIINSLQVAALGIYTSARIKKGFRAGGQAISEIFVALMGVSVVLVLAIDLSAPFIAHMIAPAFDGKAAYQLAGYLRIVSGVIPLAFGSMILSTVLSSHEHYFVIRLRSFFLSACVIGCCIFLSDPTSVRPLFAAEYMSYAFWFVPVYFIARKCERIHLANPFGSVYVKEAIGLMLPVVLGNSVSELNYMIDRSIASSIADGAMSALYYGQVMDQFVSGVIISSVISVTFAHMANLIAREKEQELKRVLEEGISILMMILIPTSVLIISNAQDAIRIVYYRGEFTYDGVLMATVVLQGYALQYVFSSIRDILARVLYSYHDTRRPTIASVISAIVNAVVSISLCRYIGLFAVPFGTAVSACIGMILNMKLIHSKIIFSFGFAKRIARRSVPAMIILIGILYLKEKYLKTSIEIIDFAGSAIVSYGVYFGVMYLYKETLVRRIVEHMSAYMKKLRIF